MVINALPSAMDFQTRLTDLDGKVDTLIIAQAATRVALGAAQADLLT